MSVRKFFLEAIALSAALLTWPGDAVSGTNDPPPAPPAAQPLPCSLPEYRQFDFWIGNWEVRDPSGAVVGHNRISRELNGCMLHENWAGKGGMNGQSLNGYYPPAGLWHQTWMGDDGSFLLLDGTFKEGKMVMEGKQTTRKGGTVINRISWEPKKDGSVRQLWEISTDTSATWKVVFDGLYVKVG